MAEAEKEKTATGTGITYEARDGQEIKLSFDTVRRYLVQGDRNLVTDQELMMFMGTCKARGLNPFKKDCYLVKYTQAEPAATIVSIDYYRSRARAQADCVGWKSGVILMKADGLMEWRTGTFITEGEKVLGGWFKAKPKSWEEPYEWSIALEPFIKKTRDGQVTKFWSPEKQAYMINKVAESQGLRRLWPDEFQNLFIEDELDDARDVTPNREALPIPQPVKEEEGKQADDGERVSGTSEANESIPDARAEDRGPGAPATSAHDQDRKSPRQSAPRAPAPAAAGLEERYEWIKTATLDQIVNDNMALRNMKGFTQAQQAALCRAVNDRRADLIREEEASAEHFAGPSAER